MTGQRFIDCIVDNLEHHVMEAGTVRRVTDIHSGTQADRFEARLAIAEARVRGRET